MQPAHLSRRASDVDDFAVLRLRGNRRPRVAAAGRGVPEEAKRLVSRPCRAAADQGVVAVPDDGPKKLSPLHRVDAIHLAHQLAKENLPLLQKHRIDVLCKRLHFCAVDGG